MMSENRNKRIKLNRMLARNWNLEAGVGIEQSIPPSLFASLTAADLILVANALGQSFRAGITYGQKAACKEGWVWDAAAGHGRELTARGVFGPEHVVDDVPNDAEVVA